MSETERLLYEGYRVPYPGDEPGRSERCVCGEWIRPTDASQWALVDAIRRHQMSDHHEEWRRCHR